MNNTAEQLWNEILDFESGVSRKVKTHIEYREQLIEV